MKNILFFFVDGVGLGSVGPSNPFAEREWTTLEFLAGNQKWTAPFVTYKGSHLLAQSIDATLGIGGLPQSGTGQATLFTGVNCANLVGRHFGPFPHSQTYPTLKSSNLFTQIQNHLGVDTPLTFANAFPPQYFDAPSRRATVTTQCCEAADLQLLDITALRENRALAADLTSTSWRSHLDLDVEQISLHRAANVLHSIAREHRLTLFEYFLTDKVGHARLDIPPVALLETLEQVWGTLIEEIDPSHTSLVITSDHGNFEDLSHTQHTRNPVPLVVYGWAAPFFEHASDLTDVTPGIVDALRSTR